MLSVHKRSSKPKLKYYIGSICFYLLETW